MPQSSRCRVTPPVLSALLLGFVPCLSPARAAPRIAVAAPERNGWLVIAAGAPDRERGEGLLEQYIDAGLPQHADFPRLIESATVAGLKPGFWIVVAGAPRSERVAKILASYIGKTMAGAYYRSVTIPDPEALRLVVVESTTGSSDELRWYLLLAATAAKSDVYCMYGTKTCFAADDASTARVKNGSMPVVLPFVGTATRGDLAAEPSLHAAWGAGCRVSVSGKRDDELFTFDSEITTFKRVQLKCEYTGD